MRAALAIIALLLAFTARSQPHPQLPVVAPIPSTNQTLLTWSNNAPRYAVYTGPSRQSLPHRVVVSTNAIPQLKTNYAIAALVTNKSGVWIEGAKSYWPSNAIYVTYMQESVNGGFNWSDVAPVATTNLASMLRLVSRVVKYE